MIALAFIFVRLSHDFAYFTTGIMYDVLLLRLAVFLSAARSWQDLNHLNIINKFNSFSVIGISGNCLVIFW